MPNNLRSIYANSSKLQKFEAEFHGVKFAVRLPAGFTIENSHSPLFVMLRYNDYFIAFVSVNELANDADAITRLAVHAAIAFDTGYKAGFAQCKACYVSPSGDPI